MKCDKALAERANTSMIHRRRKQLADLLLLAPSPNDWGIERP